MWSIPAAMTFDLLRRGRWGLLAAFLGANAIPLILLAAIRAHGRIDPANEEMHAIHLVLVQLNMFIFGAGVLPAAGPLARLYALPVRTCTLVTWRLLPSMTLLAAQSLGSAAAVNWLFDLDWPLWGPALFAATALAAIQAAAWLTERSAWMLVTVGLVAAAAGIWFRMRYSALIGGPVHVWRGPTADEALTLLTVCLAAFAAAVWGVARNRRGDPPFSLGIVEWLRRLPRPAPAVGRPFRSRAEAQFWFEWRRKGWALPAAAALAAAAGVIGWGIFNRDPKSLLEGFVAGGVLLTLAGLGIGFMLGNCGRNDADYEIVPFLATRPLTTTQMAKATLKTAAWSVLAAWAVWLASLSAVFLALKLAGVTIGPVLPRQIGWWYFPATALGPWVVVALLASAGLAGRAKLFLQLLCAGLAILIGVTLLAKFTFSPEAREHLRNGAMAAAGMFAAFGTALVLAAALRRGLIGAATVWPAGGTWIAVSATVLIAWSAEPFAPLPIVILVLGLLALTVAPLAAAPLALAWNRHR